MNSPINLSFIVLLFLSLGAAGQPTYSSLDITKPPKYENRILGSEKTDDKKFKTPRHFIQNTITHYNAYFNSVTKINEVVDHAKAVHKDDFNKLLSFYNYDLQTTARDKRELDSVIFKANAAILNHDLRNDWIDNMYTLMGRAYYFSNKLDSAHITFQYINFVFAPKEEGGYDIPIGSNTGLEQGTNALTISTKEKKNALKKVFSLPPSRNESFIWQSRTYIAQNALSQASSLIEILKHDPNFPDRLKLDLLELQAWWFYQQKIYDSAAYYLQRALPNAANRGEQARWEYLIAQMYERIQDHKKAQQFYGRAIAHTYDPVLDVYARLNYIRQNEGDDEKLVAQNIAAMESMARKDRYADYRDIIYYMAAQIELEHNHRQAGINFLVKCVKNTGPASDMRNKAFMQLASLEFFDKKYKAAKSFYDSVNIANPTSIDSFDLFKDRKKALDKIVANLLIIETEDSLQRVAAMAKADRDAYIKKLVKLLRKKQGLKEEEQDNFTGGVSFGGAPNNPFGTTTESTEWYFNNPSLKSRGFNDFRARWGNRPNSDNWFLLSLVSQSQKRFTPSRDDDQANAAGGKGGKAKEITFQSLEDNLPLTPEKLKKSNDSVENAYFHLGKTYQEGPPDYYYAIDAYDSLLSRFATTHYREETLFNMYYCYLKIGDDANANRILAMMKNDYPGGKYTRMILNPDEALNPDKLTQIQATKRYEDIYTAFIEGRFEEAIAKKQSADSLYGEKYWTPQLLFIESVYYIHVQQDSAARVVLNHIINRYTGTPIAEKAKTFLDVLSRRKQIEAYLTHLQIERAKEDSVVTFDDRSLSRTIDSSRTRKQPTADTTEVAVAKRNLGNLQPGRQKREDSARNVAPRPKIDNTQLAQIKVSASQLAMLQRQMDSLETVARKAQADSLANATARSHLDSIRNVLQKFRTDSERLVKRLQSQQSMFTFSPDQPHNVALLVTKVDPVYVTETRNAFNRYDRENYYNQPMTINNASFDDSTKLVVIGGFANASAALAYLEQARKLAPREIIPWLPVTKYSFIIITDDNLERLKSSKDLPEYRKFLSAFFPGKF